MRKLRRFSTLVPSELGEKIKSYEQRFETNLEAGFPFVVRLDGVSFKKLTSTMEKPFDKGFAQSMLHTAVDLMERTVARTAFVQSDEISLVFPSEQNINNIIYNGRVQKIVSVISGFASARFNHHLSKIKACTFDSCFDARVFTCPSEKEAMEAIYWRHKYDCRRNAINSIGTFVLGHGKMQYLPMAQVIESLKKEKNINPFQQYSPLFMYGAFLKKTQFTHLGYNPIKKESVPTLRTKIEARTFDWEMPESERTSMTMAKFWEPTHQASLQEISLNN